MRQLKFRAWDEKNKIMLAGIDPFAQDKTKVKIMQFTGLKDKNGKEIYEGDILTIERGLIGKKVSVICQVKWNVIEGSFELISIEDNSLGYMDELGVCEVVGNIYENPELLK